MWDAFGGCNRRCRIHLRRDSLVTLLGRTQHVPTLHLAVFLPNCTGSSCPFRPCCLWQTPGAACSRLAGISYSYQPSRAAQVAVTAALLAACCHCPVEYLAHCPGCRRFRVLPRAAIVSPFVRVLAFARPLVPARLIVLIHFVKFI